ncbi:MAG: polysaccharide biosynthesis protein [uncultured bacterium]|nr:MAG: polysaccharide biosynthesis protein [uncultured bacterium]
MGLFIFGPKLIPLIFGSQWEVAGIYIKLLSLMYLFKFFVSTLSYTLYIAEKQFINLLWQGTLFACTLGSMYLGYYRKNPEISILAFSASYTFLYIVMLYLSYRYTTKKG